MQNGNIQFKKEKIIELRERLGITQYEFGKRLSTTRQRVHQWEQGITRPNMDAIEDMCRVFSVAPEYFFASDHVCVHN